MCDSYCFCVKCNTKPFPEKLEDWAKIKAHREAFSNSDYSVETILRQWSVNHWAALHALARRIQRDDTPPTPPVPQDVLIWRETVARYLERIGLSRGKCDAYRNGLRDDHYDEITREAIKLALEGFGKEVT